MQSLFEQYKTLKESYYGAGINAERLFDEFRGKENCRRFIDDHFIRGSKKRVFLITEDYEDDHMNRGKHQHTVSLYLLGLLCRDLFDKRLKSRMRQLFCVRGWYAYEYTWYLACLYHDVTSVKEKDTDFADRADRACGSMLFEPEYDDLRRFPKDVYVNYINYRERSRISHDHGIIAGTELFARLCEAFREATDDHDWDKAPELQRGNLVWRKEHLPHFAYIADAICCHNMWTAKQDDEERCEEYRQAGLEALIVNSESDKLSPAEYPLQFLLCLLDTIEPVKRFTDLDAKTVLENISLDIQESGFTLAWTDAVERSQDYKSWIKSISEVGDWMRVRILPDSLIAGDRSMTFSW